VTDFSEPFTLRWIEEDADIDAFSRQISKAAQGGVTHDDAPQGRPQAEEPTDHEAEGAMRYVMSRGSEAKCRAGG
jgi:hypothetical protein